MMEKIRCVLEAMQNLVDCPERVFLALDVVDMHVYTCIYILKYMYMYVHMCVYECVYTWVCIALTQLICISNFLYNTYINVYAYV